jgi:hypothetical protein
MCKIFVPWHVVNVHSHVTIQDDDGCFVGTMKNSFVASDVVNHHNSKLAEETLTLTDGWVAKSTSRKATKNESRRSAVA